MAQQASSSIVPVYCFDPRDYGKSSSGFDKTGPYRAKFLIECVADLRKNLRERGSELVVRIGKPEEVRRVWGFGRGFEFLLKDLKFLGQGHRMYALL
jgi:deoxyribodipyrimidine photolyase